LFAILAKRNQFTKIKLSVRLLVWCLDHGNRVETQSGGRDLDAKVFRY
jgi:hypothetical protein